MTTMNNYAGQALKNLRGKKTQAEIAELLGCHAQFISLVENGHSKMPVPSISVLKKNGFNVRPLLKGIIKDFENELKENVKWNQW